MSQENLPSYIQYLLQAGSYPHAAGSVSLIQTHISFVIVTDGFVYKWKKPVNFGFLDFSTLEKRKYCCEQELALNRRLCPEIYRDLVTINETDGMYSLCGSGNIVEYGIQMLRMPEERMMSRLIQAGRLTKEDLDAIVAKLIPFYEAAETGATIREFGRSSAVAVNVLENFDQTEGLVGKGGLTRQVFDQIKAYARSVLAEKQLFDDRVAAGRIRDCHGDLYSANICLADQVYIFDCIEFNDRFRYSDLAADVAFLAMDLDFHDLSDLSSYFISRFVAASGDQGLLKMLNFYKCYRAYVRGKIGLFTAGDPAVDPATAERCLIQADRYFQLAARYAAVREG
jgi:aminoglycoside phosphotransferase family enzyme